MPDLLLEVEGFGAGGAGGAQRPVVAQGFGQALWEEVVFNEDGQLVTGSLMDYAIPHADQYAAVLENEGKAPLFSVTERMELIRRWHKHGRSQYAITPRFAPTSTEEQMELAGALARQYPDTYLQTHVSENQDECRWVQQLYPQAHGGRCG